MMKYKAMLLSGAALIFFTSTASAQDITSRNTAFIKSLNPNWKQLLAVNLSPMSEPNDAGESRNAGNAGFVTICTKEKLCSGGGA